MVAVALRDPGAALWNDLSQAHDKPSTLDHARKNDAHYGIKEVQALRRVDLVAPPEMADLAEPLVKMFSGEITSGDHLRLPQLTSHDGPAMNAAIGRILSVDTQSVGGDREAVVKEEKMRRVLQALQFATTQIQMRTTASNY